MKQVCAAFVKAQKEFAPALKSSTNPHYKSKYAALDACIEAVIDALNNNGIALVQRCRDVPTGITVDTLFIHESGEIMEAGCLHVPAAKQDPQGYGSALTYARRYCLMAACGIAPEDDDGNAASVKTKPIAKKEEPKPDIEIPEGMTILEFATQMFPLCATLDELKQMFKQLYRQSSNNTEAQATIKTLYDTRKAELGE